MRVGDESSIEGRSADVRLKGGEAFGENRVCGVKATPAVSGKMGSELGGRHVGGVHGKEGDT